MAKNDTVVYSKSGRNRLEKEIKAIRTKINELRFRKQKRANKCNPRGKELSCNDLVPSPDKKFEVLIESLQTTLKEKEILYVKYVVSCLSR